MTNENLTSYGSIDGIEIFRHNGKNGLSGIIFSTGNTLMTARHVVLAHNLEGFTHRQGRDFDIAFKPNGGHDNNLLGYSDDFVIHGVKAVTSTIEEPEKLIEIPGSIGLFFCPTMLSEFKPNQTEQYSLFKTGASGSPILYDGHVIGLVTHSNLEQYTIAGLTFNGRQIRTDLEELGLEFKTIPSRKWF